MSKNGNNDVSKIGLYHWIISFFYSFYGKATKIPNKQVVTCGDSGMLKSLSTQSNERKEKCVCRWLSTTITCFNVFKINSSAPYPVTTTILWPTSDRIPHSLIFKRMQFKRIADNIRALFFLIDKLQQRTWRKEKLLLNQVFSQVRQ